MLEKSSCISLTQVQVDLIKSGVFPVSLDLSGNWDIKTFDELREIVDSGQYRLVEAN